MRQSFHNYFMRFLLYIASLINQLKVALGLLPLKYGLMGHFEHEGASYTSMWHDKERLMAVKDWDSLRPDDVVLLTYPKTGTHFAAEIILSIYLEVGALKAHHGLYNHMCLLDTCPPKFTGLRSADESVGMFSDMETFPSPRIVASHLPWNCLPASITEGNTKIIHCTRNPKDVLCSYFSFSQGLRLYYGNLIFKDFLAWFMQENVMDGGFFHYLKQWYPHRNKPNMLNLQFEDMKKNLETNVKEIAAFLDMKPTQQQVDRIVMANTFENKKRELGQGHLIYRKGKVGGWKTDITVNQNEMLDEWIEREMENMPELYFQYE